MDATAQLADRIRQHLCAVARTTDTISYHALAQAMELSPPNTIYQVTQALELLMAQDVADERPLIAVFVISKNRSGLPAGGFFDCASRLGRLTPPLDEASCHAFHTTELEAARRYWRDPHLH